MVELVKDYMIKKKEIVAPEDSVISAIELMIENDIGSVIVVDEKTGAVQGIFTERDILRRFMTSRSKFIHLKISEVMTKPVHTVQPDTKLAEAVKMMRAHDVARLPVVDKDGKLVGILFWKDIFDNFCCDKIQ
ncbi:MAG: CBS domain-containing protein [Methanomassiliicoccus sp.]|nr:CBS domain-containing protein [Methanomassiliicoccus sp.]